MQNTVSTDDAYVNGHVTLVASRVSGQVSRVLVDDNDRVKKGALLVQLDKEVPLFVGLSVVPYVYYKERPTGPQAGAVLRPPLPRRTGPTDPTPSPAPGASEE
jgi:hypothetical protein